MAERDALLDAGVSDREAEVLELVAERATNAEIAARLFVSVRTVESHVSSLLRKLDVTDRRALAKLAHSVAPARAAGASGDASSDYAGSDEAIVDVSDRPSRPTAAPRSPADAATGRSLPVPLTSFVGRAAEVAALVDALETARLVTALGAGGVGKTRLATAAAAAVADRWADGVWFVDLVPVTDEALVPAAVSRSLGLADAAGRSSEEHVLAHLAGRSSLLVLDNCEHLVDGVGVFVERLLTRCPRVTVLATSQARLRLPFEQVFAVPGLSLPSDAEQGDAVSLFVERAGQAGGPAIDPAELERVATICRRLDGSALAIELAAARLPSLGLDGIERGLGERFELLEGGSRVDARHRSLRSTIDWSYDLLDPADQALLRRVCVFAGPFTADAAVTVAGPLTDDGPAGAGAAGRSAETAVAAGLARLAEHSLLVTTPGPITRHRVLDSIRQYGHTRMAEGPALGDAERATATSPDELTEIRRRHHAWATATMRELDRRADIPLRDAIGRAAEFAAWRQDFDRVGDDARAAVRWAHHADRAQDTFELAHLLGSTTFTRGLLGESQRRYEQAAAHAPSAGVAAQALIEAAGAASSRHVGNDSLRLWRAAATTAQQAGDDGTAAYALARAAELLLRGPGIIADKPPPDTHRELLAEAKALGSDDPQARAAIETAVIFDLDETDPAALEAARRAVASAEAIDDPLLLSAALDGLAAVDLGLGDLEGAVEASRRRSELIASMRASALSAFEVGDGYHMASEIALAAGDFASARRYAEMSDHVSFHAEEGHLATSRLLKVDAMAGEVGLVVANADRFRRGWEDAGRPVASNLAGGSYAVAMAHGLRGDDAARTTWIDITRTLATDTRHKIDGCDTGFAPTMDAVVALHRGDAETAIARLADDPADLRTWYTGEWRTWYAALHAEAAALAGHPDAAARIARARPIVTPNPVTAAMLDRAAALLADDRRALVPIADRLERSGCPYQWARTLVLAGGDAAERGRQALDALGIAPMAEV